MDDIADRAGRLQAGALPALPGQARPLPRPARQALRGPRAASSARPSPSTRTTSSASTRTIAAYFDFVTREGAAFRLIFESDLTNEPAVRNAPRRRRADLRRGARRGHRRGHRRSTDERRPPARHGPDRHGPGLARGTGSPRAATSPEAEAAALDRRARLARPRVFPKVGGKVPDPPAALACVAQGRTRSYAACPTAG